MEKAVSKKCISGSVFALAIGAICCLSAPSTGRAAENKAISKPFLLETFFAGKTHARGVFESGIAGIRREFSVKTYGKWNGKVFTLVEDFIYDDGERGRKTWRFTKLGPGKYEGTREDVVGKADVTQTDGIIKLAYTIDVPGKDGSTTRVYFDDTIKQIDDRRALNTATVYKYVFPVASVRVDFERIPR